MIKLIENTVYRIKYDYYIEEFLECNNFDDLIRYLFNKSCEGIFVKAVYRLVKDEGSKLVDFRNSQEYLNILSNSGRERHEGYR